jgi:hypothetical protein
VVVGYSQMLGAATVTIDNPQQSLMAMFVIFALVDAVNLSSEALRWGTWKGVPIRWPPYVLGAAVAIAYALRGHWAGFAGSDFNLVFLWATFVLVMIRGIWLRYVYKAAM